MRSARENLKFVRDIAKMAGGATGSFADLRGQIKSMVREGLDRVLGELDLVTREEFERVETVARKARERQEQLEKRLAALEKKQPKAPAKKKARK